MWRGKRKMGLEFPVRINIAYLPLHTYRFRYRIWWWIMALTFQCCEFRKKNYSWFSQFRYLARISCAMHSLVSLLPTLTKNFWFMVWKRIKSILEVRLFHAKVDNQFRAAPDPQTTFGFHSSFSCMVRKLNKKKYALLVMFELNNFL